MTRHKVGTAPPRRASHSYPRPRSPSCRVRVHAADYQTVGTALLDALAAVHGDGFDAPTRQAWALAYNLVAETMLDWAAFARPIGS